MKEYIKIIIYILIFCILIYACTKLYNNLSNNYNQDIILENSVSTEIEKIETDNIKDNVEEEKNIEKAKDFSVINKDGKNVKLSDYFGSPIVVNFWATWCSPCKSELPAFEELSKKYDGKVIFMMVNLTDGYQETVEGVKEFIKENNYEFSVFFDTEYSASNAYQTNYIPETIFIDKDGNMVNKHIGAMNKETLKNYIDTLIGE